MALHPLTKKVFGFRSLNGPEKASVSWALAHGATLDSKGKLIIRGTETRDAVALSFHAKHLPVRVLSDEMSVAEKRGLYRNVKIEYRPKEFQPRVFRKKSTVARDRLQHLKERSRKRRLR